MATTPDSGAAKEDGKRKTAATGSKWGSHLRCLISDWEFPDRWIGWRNPGLNAVRGLSFDAVLATTPPYSSVVIAREVASSCGATLVLDYRDPWLEAPRHDADPKPFQRHHLEHQALEDAALAEAGLVIGSSRTICRTLTARGAARSLYIPNTVDIKTAPVQDIERHNIVYIGSLAYGRSLLPILRGMKRCSAFRGAGSLRLTYAGGDGPRAIAEARTENLENFLDVRGLLSQKQARDLVAHSQVAVLLTTPGYEYNIPGKLSEYLALGTPLLLVAPQDGEMAEIFREHTLGRHFTPDDSQGIAEFLHEALNGPLLRPQVPKEFESDHIMARLDSTLREVLPRG